MKKPISRASKIEDRDTSVRGASDNFEKSKNRSFLLRQGSLKFSIENPDCHPRCKLF